MKTPEEIKKGIECCHGSDGMRNCEDCPYAPSRTGSWRCYTELADDIVVMVRELEATAKTKEITPLANCRDYDNACKISIPGDEMGCFPARLLPAYDFSKRLKNVQLGDLNAVKMHLRKTTDQLEEMFADQKYNMLRGLINAIIDMNQVTIEIIDEMPAVEAEPVRHGRWVKTEYDGYVCSLCGEEAPNDGFDCGAKYCYECGAKMDGGAE